LFVVFCKTTFDNLRIVSGLNFRWLLIRFLTCWRKARVSTFHPVTDFGFLHFRPKYSNHLSIEIEVLYTYFHCSQWKYVWIKAVRCHSDAHGLPLFA
jgi:hypothetical protein